MRRAAREKDRLTGGDVLSLSQLFLLLSSLSLAAASAAAPTTMTTVGVVVDCRTKNAHGSLHRNLVCAVLHSVTKRYTEIGELDSDSVSLTPIPSSSFPFLRFVVDVDLTLAASLTFFSVYFLLLFHRNPSQPSTINPLSTND